MSKDYFQRDYPNTRNYIHSEEGSGGGQMRDRLEKWKTATPWEMQALLKAYEDTGLTPEEIRDTQAALAEAVGALKLLTSSAVVFADDRVDYVKMQIYKDDLEGARQIIQSPAAKAALQAYEEVAK